METTVVIDKREWEKLLQRLDAVVNFINTQQEIKTTKNRQLEKDWITLKEWQELYSKGRSSWFDKYKDFIKHRVDGSLLIYKPSMDKYLMDKSIN